MEDADEVGDRRFRAPPESVILGLFEGIKNHVNRERLTSSQLEVAINVDIDDAKQIRRRRGYEQVLTGNWHSLWRSEGGSVLGVRDGVLVRLQESLAVEPLVEVGTDPLSYCTFGPLVLFSSRTASGKITPDGTVLPWGREGGAAEWVSPVVNPTATLPEVAGRLVGPPPLAEWIEEMSGRVYLAQGSTLWATDLYLVDDVDRTRGFMQFESPITGLVRCGEGMYVGTATAVYYLSGPFGEMRRRDVVSVGCLPGSMLRTQGDLALQAGEPALQHRDMALFMTEQGLICGFPNGFCRNLTNSETLFPTAERVAPMFRSLDGVNQYVGVLKGSGTPVSSAQIGDYIDVEIIRAAHARP